MSDLNRYQSQLQQVGSSWKKRDAITQAKRQAVDNVYLRALELSRQQAENKQEKGQEDIKIGEFTLGGAGGLHTVYEGVKKIASKVKKAKELAKNIKDKFSNKDENEEDLGNDEPTDETLMDNTVGETTEGIEDTANNVVKNVISRAKNTLQNIMSKAKSGIKNVGQQVEESVSKVGEPPKGGWNRTGLGERMEGLDQEGGIEMVENPEMTTAPGRGAKITPTDSRDVSEQLDEALDNQTSAENVVNDSTDVATDVGENVASNIGEDVGTTVADTVGETAAEIGGDVALEGVAAGAQALDFIPVVGWLAALFGAGVSVYEGVKAMTNAEKGQATDDAKAKANELTAQANITKAIPNPSGSYAMPSFNTVKNFAST